MVKLYEIAAPIINNTNGNGGFEVTAENGEKVVSPGLIVLNNMHPEAITLNQNYPNPFNPQTSINWTMPDPGEISLDIYNIRGQFIENVFNGIKESGNHEINWIASAYPSGIYFYRLTIDERILQKKMILLK